MYPETGDSAEAMVRAADIAVHHVKARGKNACQFFDARMGEVVSSQMLIERELRNALLTDELEPHYQPQVNVETGEVVGVEALARWNHPERGEVSPAEFIPLAEETGLIVPVDQASAAQCLSGRGDSPGRIRAAVGRRQPVLLPRFRSSQKTS